MPRNDLTIYDTFADHWWDATSAFSCSLHEVNRLCLDEIVEVMGPDLRGRTIIDLGCGGGLLADPLAHRGAVVLACDISRPSLCAAVRHRHPGTILAPVLGDARQPPFATAGADLVLCADILEHIPAWRRVVAAAALLLRPGGRIFVSTLTRSWASSLLGVHLAEGLGFVPKGTHDPALFIRPEEVAACAAAAGLTASVPIGLTPNLWQTVRTRRLHLRRTKRVVVEYSMWLQRPAEIQEQVA